MEIKKAEHLIHGKEHIGFARCIGAEKYAEFIEIYSWRYFRYKLRSWTFGYETELLTTVN